MFGPHAWLSGTIPDREILTAGELAARVEAVISGGVACPVTTAAPWLRGRMVDAYRRRPSPEREAELARLEALAQRGRPRRRRPRGARDDPRTRSRQAGTTITIAEDNEMKKQKATHKPHPLTRAERRELAVFTAKILAGKAEAAERQLMRAVYGSPTELVDVDPLPWPEPLLLPRPSGRKPTDRTRTP